QESPTVESATQGFGNDWRAALGIDDGDGGTDLDLEALVEDDTQAPTMLATGSVPAPTSDTSTFGALSDEWSGAAAESPAIDADAPTMETPWAAAEDGHYDSDSPTMESPWGAPGVGGSTVETPTIEAAGSEAPTIETPTIETQHSHTAVLRIATGETGEL